MPSLMISFLIFGILISDIIFEKINVLIHYLKHKSSQNEVINSEENTSNNLQVVSFVIYFVVIILIVASYFFYYPFTYFTTVHKEDFDARNLVRDWGLKWPGK